MIGLAMWDRPVERERFEVKSLRTNQLADPALGFSYEKDGKQITPRFDPRFVRLSAFERAKIPEAVRLTAPMGTESGGGTYIAQRFWDQNDKRGGRHSGDDVNGIGGMNTDLGDPLYSIGDGLVLFAGEASPGWGKVVLIAHRTEKADTLQSMYAHLDRIDVASGSVVHRGQQVGTVGTGNNNYLAHLHFELRDAVTVDVLRGYLAEQGVHLDPDVILERSTRFVKPIGPPSALKVLQEVRLEEAAGDLPQLRVKE